MKTAAIQIGNSDDKLSQSDWSKFVEQMRFAVADSADALHFFAASEGSSPWQNACWVIEIDEGEIASFLCEIERIRKNYKQDSVAVLIGKAEFI